jgi:hypothetical protein
MTYWFVGVAVLVSVFVAAIGIARHRPAAAVPLQPRPQIYRSIRVLHNDDEIRDAARRALERERLIADEADRRGAHFRQLTHLEPGFTAVRVIASGAPRDRELAAGD